MIRKVIATGVVHKIPLDVRKIIISEPKLLVIWENITSLARNEWLCWILSAKKQETRERRIKILHENLLMGKRRPCCWAGCTHR